MTLPQHPSEINSFFILHTRETEFTFSDLKNETLQQVADKIGTRKMKIIIHGLLGMYLITSLIHECSLRSQYEYVIS